MSSWAARAQAVEASSVPGERADYRSANATTIRRVVAGEGLDSGKVRAAAGARVVFNVAAAHVRAVLRGRYLNGYDLEQARTGAPKPQPVSTRRRRVDAAVAICAGGGAAEADLYYGAVEVNGAGMRYYGDLCLVLKPGEIPAGTLVLFRNSYDLDREPLRGRIGDDDRLRVAEARRLAGTWRDDVQDMAVCKILDGVEGTPRLMTTGTVSEGVLIDEDYIEAPRVGSFGKDAISEIRTSAADAATEALIADRQARGPTPPLARLLWRHRRRMAERMARAAGIDVRVVGGHGRAGR